MGGLDSFYNFLSEIRIVLLIFVGIITIIGTLDKYFPTLLPKSIKKLDFIKNALPSSNSSSRLLRMGLTICKSLVVFIWKLSVILYKFFVALFSFILSLFFKALHKSKPIAKTVMDNIENATGKLDDLSERLMKEEIKDKTDEKETARPHPVG